MRIWTVSIALLISTQLMAQEIPAVKFDGIEDLISEKSDKVKVINFWATWCKPCIQELPEFEKLNSDNQDVEVYLVSMDFVEDMEKVEGLFQ